MKDGNKIQFDRGKDKSDSKEATVVNTTIVNTPERGNVAWLKGLAASIKLGYFNSHCLA